MQDKDLFHFDLPENIEQLQMLFAQFQNFIPEDKRQIIENALNDIAASGGIRDTTHGQELIGYLLENLGKI